ncbi:MAG: hypothetical protein O7F08_08255, partial [Deltaproteobacteria bacterium]|nr:hypothetical protein [Deltaproteobacteria bacterium]
QVTFRTARRNDEGEQQRERNALHVGVLLAMSEPMAPRSRCKGANPSGQRFPMRARLPIWGCGK